MLIKQLAGPLSDDWEIVHNQPITHPTNPSVRGALVQHRQTAVYRIAAAGAVLCQKLLYSEESSKL